MRNRLFITQNVVILLSLMSLCYCQNQSPDNDTKQTSGIPTPSQAYPHVVELDKGGMFFLFWEFDEERITFEVHVRTHGWVGLGFTNNGRMQGADIVVGWIKDGVTYFKDRHANGQTRPLVDDEQDYNLHLAIERDDFTIFKFSRKLKTCDENDYEIHAGTVRVIFAWSDDDPESEDSFLYHGSTRGTRSVAFLDYAEPNNSDNNDNLQSFDVMQNLVSLPKLITYYHCRYITPPKLDRKHHIVKIEPVIEEKNLGVVHHIVIYQCHGQPIPDENGQTCSEAQMAPNVSCDSVLFAWAIGQEAFNIPKEAGMSIGAPGDPTYFTIETHYNNPQLLSDMVDSSGLRIYYTDKLREHDVGVLVLGNTIGLPPLIIPPHMDRLRLDTFCGARCTESMIPEEGIQVFGTFLHTHLLGVALWTKHVRDGVELPEIIRDDHYDFDYQFQRTLASPVHVLPGDELITTCVYSSSNYSNLVYGGAGTDNEMCLNFVLYYPRMELQSCLSQVQDEKFIFDLTKLKNEKCVGNGTIESMQRKIYGCLLNNMTWDDEARQIVQNQIDETTEFDQHCIRQGERSYSQGRGFTRAERIRIQKPYIKNDLCRKDFPETSGSRGVNGYHTASQLMNIFVLVLVIIYH